MSRVGRELEDLRREVARLSGGLGDQDERLAGAFEGAPLAVLRVDGEGRVSSVPVPLGGEAGETPIGRPAGEALRCARASVGEGCGKAEACKTCVLRSAIARTLQARQGVYKQAGTLPREGAEDCRFLVTTALTQAASRDEVLVVLEDVTGREELYAELLDLRQKWERRAEVDAAIASRSLEQLDQLNRMLRAIRNVNQLIVREKDPQRLVRQACEALVETRGCLGAWVAVEGPDGAPAAWAEAGWAGDFAPVGALLERREWPPCHAELARRGGPAVLDGQEACQGCPLCDPCRARKPVVAPLRHGDRSFGQLVLSFPEEFVLDEEELGLVEEVAGDLAFALHAIATEEERRWAEWRHRTLVDESPVGILLLDETGKVCEANKCWLKMVDIDPRDLVDRDAFSVAQEGASGLDVAALRDDLKARLEGREGFSEVSFRRRDGEQVTLAVKSVPLGSVGGVRQLLYLFDDITERKRSERQRRESEERARLLLEHLPACVVVHDAQSRITFANPQACAFLGLTLDQLMGKAAMDLAWRFVRADGTTMPPSEHPVQRVLASGQPLQGLELGVDRPARSDRVWCLVNAFPEFDKGALRQVVVTFVDITERRFAEQAMAESERRFRQVFETAPMPLAIFPRDGSFMLFNQQFEDVFGYTKADVRSLGDFQRRAYPDPAYRQMVLDSTRAFVESTGAAARLPPAERQITCKDGRVLTGLLYGSRSGDTVLVAFIDMTEAKRADKQVRAAHLRLQAIIDNLQDFYVRVDLDGRLTLVSPSAARAFGYRSVAEMIGARAVDHYADPEDHERLQGAMAADGRARDFVALARRRDGSTFWASMSVQYLRDAQGNVVGAEGIVRDISERVAAEERDRLQSEMLDDAPAGIVVYDAQGNIRYANKSAAALHGWTRDELLKQPEGLVSGDSDRAQWALRFEPLPEGKELVFEARHMRRDGTVVPVRVQARRVQWHGEPAVLAVETDLTEAKRAEAELVAAHGRLQRILDNLQDAYFQSDLRDRIIEANPSAARLYHYDSARDLVGIEAATLWADPEVRQAFLEQLQKAGRVSDRVGQARRKDGSTFWASMSAQHLLEDGMVVGVEWMIRDITERVLAEERDRLQSEMLDAAPAGIVVYDAQGNNRYANQNAAKLHGWTVEEFLRLDVDAIQADEDKASHRDRFARLLQGEELSFEVNHLRSDGTTVPLQIHARTVQWQGEPAILAVQTDLTERRKAEDERRRLQASLAQSDRLASMGMLAAGVAHEINNPLAYSLYNLESLSADLARLTRQLGAIRQGFATRRATEALHEFLGAGFESLESLSPAVWGDVMERFRDALAGNRKIKEIVRGLGTFSRVEEDQQGAVELRHPIESALSIASNEIKYRARVDRDFGPTAPVNGSEGRLSQVFLNLFINAAHAIHEGDVEKNRIRVRTWQEGATVLAEVQDTGCGIPPENLARIFDPFFTTKPVGVGSGLGLSIVKNIVTGYGGTIEVTSEVGKGTRFLVRLPAMEDLPEPVRHETGRGQDEAAPTGRILVIDDDPGIRAALRRILERHEVLEADSGERGCEVLAKDQRFDVVLCDMMMPKMSGMDVHKWLEEKDPALAKRVVFVTGGAFTPAARAYLTRVGNLRVEKPFDGTNLRKMVVEWVRAAQAGKT